MKYILIKTFWFFVNPLRRFYWFVCRPKTRGVKCIIENNGTTATRGEIIIGGKLDFTIKAGDEDNHYPLTIGIISPSGSPFSLSCAATSQTGSGAYKTSCRVTVDQLIAETRDYTFSATATDSYGEVSESVNFIVKIKNNPPRITSSSLPEAKPSLFI